MIDSRLVLQAKQGDMESFTELYGLISPELYKLALYTLGNTHDAQDAVSETVIEAYKGIKNLRSPESFKSWIFKILTIRCKHRIKTYIKDRNHFDIDDFADANLDGKDMALENAEKIDVLVAMEKLKPDERQLVVLSVLQGYTTKEISKMLGAPHGTVCSKLYRTFSKLRKTLS